MEHHKLGFLFNLPQSVHKTMLGFFLQCFYTKLVCRLGGCLKMFEPQTCLSADRNTEIHRLRHCKHKATKIE